MKQYRYWLWLLGWLVVCVSAQAQNQRITGRVTSQTDQSGLPGASVVIKGTTTGTTTDAEGNYSIAVTEGAVLQFSMIGMKPQEVLVGNQTTINVVLSDDAQALEEVVVVGYGTQRKRDLTGAVAQLKGEEIVKYPVQTPTQALQSRMAGVQIIASGRPNEQPQIRVRGVGSALAGVNPLYVVDGVLTDDIRNISNNDILSIEVLKDASAAIYGVRAANGVVIVTTRRGKSGATQVQYDANISLRQPANLVRMANRDQYVAYLADAAPNQNVNNPPLTSTQTTNWYDEALRNGPQSNHNLSISGGGERNTFFFSAGYFTDVGVVKTNDFRRLTIRANNEVKINDKLTFSNQLSFARGNERSVNLDGVYQNLYRAAPIVPAIIDGRYGNLSAFGNVGNPILSLDARTNRIINNRLQGNLALNYKPVEWLTLRSAFNTDLIFNRDQTYLRQFQNDAITFITAGGNQRQQNSQLTLKEGKSLRYIIDNTATIDRTFGQHNATLLLGAVTERFTSDFIEGARINVPNDPDLWYLGLGNPDQQLSNNSEGDLQTRQSFVSRLTYSFANRYLFNASLRADGSSKFSERWGYFPTVGAGWVISDEAFMKSQSVFDFLKFRASWGILGNDNIASNAYILTAAVNIPYFYNNGLTLGTAIQDIKNQQLKWERTEQIDAGLEFAFFDSRLTGEVDYYSKTTRDALAFQIIPAIFGDPDNQFLTNIASFRNRGFEFILNWRETLKSGLGYSIGGNLTLNQNQLVGLNGGQALLAGGVGQQGFVTRSDNGQPVGSFHVLNAIGVFQNQAEIDGSPVFGNRANVRPGNLKYEDVDRNGVIDNNDRIYAGSYQPKLYYGINLGLTFKGFDLTADVYGNAGNQIYNGKKAFRFENTDNIEAAYADARWQPNRPSQTDPRLITAATPASTYFVESGSFVRLNNLTLGYTIPTAWRDKAKLRTARLYVTSQNLFTIQQYSGFSPELPGGPLDSGIELNSYPTTRTFAVGLNVGF
ncbi:SusC/RagA family TonB-linked outer membrane protein [Spirosoma montaniterrae]|uniref:SusC/RagA family TonB-linked outer membrane protein n=1 Tax=Spirosoma montaniterrae TaxID=1178516 RepID=A0A1P9WWZ7_9BACT|nr:TonB-dependent receptor [Spirosoma montaniterrae]AQG79863.1 SusC/RagA family TonB-linked outer membrane protein [Spirosoma montaniterrae]